MIFRIFDFVHRVSLRTHDKVLKMCAPRTKCYISFIAMCYASILTTTSMHLTSQQAPTRPKPDTTTMNAPTTINKIDRLLARSPRSNPATLTSLRAGVTSEDTAFTFTSTPAARRPIPSS